MEPRLRVFKNNLFGEVRVVESNEEPIFCLADLCKILDLTPKGVRQRLSDEVISNYPIIDSLNRRQNALFVNEDGLYDVILDSRKQGAKAFRKWVTGEVLPAIRKTGGYMIEKEEDTEESIMARALLIAQDTIQRSKEKIRQLSSTVERQAPKVMFADAVATSHRSCLIAELAKILMQNGIQIGQNRLFEYLRKNNYLGSKGEYRNIPTQHAMELGLFEIKKTSITKPDGTVLVNTTPKVTGKGQIYFVNQLLKKQNTSQLQPEII
jgi:prophage antirepressor-like protein